MVGNLQDILPSFFVGPGGTRLSEDQIRSRMLIANSLRQQATDTSPNAGGLASILAKGVMGLSSSIQDSRLEDAIKSQNAADSSGAAALISGLDNGSAYTMAGTANGATFPTPGAAGEISATNPGNLTDSSVYNGFMEPIKGAVTNPNALAAIASTGRAESGYAPGNVYRTWNDPSASGQPGRSGGIMSWRGPRYDALVASGDLSPAGQGKFFVSENQDILPALNNAKTVEEAQSIMDRKWGFADKSGRESARRLGFAKGFLPTFQGMTDVPATSVASATNAPADTGYRDPVVASASQDTPPQTVAMPANAPIPIARPEVAQALVSPQLTPDAVRASVANALANPANAAPVESYPSVDVAKGGRLGTPQAAAPLTDQAFNDRFGATPVDTTATAAIDSVSPVATAMLAPNSAQDQPIPAGIAAATPQAAPPQSAPSQQQVAQAAPSPAQVTVPQLPLMTVPKVSPGVISALSNPNTGPQTRAVANALLEKTLSLQQQAKDYNFKVAARQQEMQQRISQAKQLGISPQAALDDETWKAAVTQNYTPHRTANVNGVLVDEVTHQPVYGTKDQPTSVQEFEYSQSHPGFADYQVSQKKAGSQSITVGGGGNTQVFDVMKDSASSAQSAATGLNSLREARKALDGGIIAGAAADQRLGLQKIGSYLGVSDPQQIVNTETFRSAIAPQVAAVMKATVGSTQISDSDRKFAQEAAGGSITLEPKSISRLLDIMERASIAAIKRNNDKLDKVYPEGQGFDRERALFHVDLPETEQRAPAKIQSKEQFDALPSGTTFIAPDGSVRTKP